jgi:hypothetical protein
VATAPKDLKDLKDPKDLKDLKDLNDPKALKKNPGAHAKPKPK